MRSCLSEKYSAANLSAGIVRTLPPSIRACMEAGGSLGYGCGEAGLAGRLTCLFLAEGLLEVPASGSPLSQTSDYWSRNS